jgi:energy-coupling factor transporter transmembrane protein EcfT
LVYRPGRTDANPLQVFCVSASLAERVINVGRDLVSDGLRASHMRGRSARAGKNLVAAVNDDDEDLGAA